MAVRTVSVELKMKISDFELAAAKAAATTKALAGEFDDLGKTSGKFSTAKPTKEMQNFSRVINGALKDGKTGFQSIQSAIDDTKAHIARLKQEIHTGSGSESIFGDLKQANKDLRTLQGVMKDIEPSTAKIAKNVESAGRDVSDLRGQLVKMGIAAAPFLAPVAAGSALGLLAAGGVGVGILGQLKDPGVQTAAKALASNVSGALASATSAFGPEIVKSLGIADAGLQKFIGSLKPAFDSLAPETATITRDLVGGLEQAGPALSRSMIKAKPDLEALSRLVGSLPTDASTFFSNLSIGAAGGARAIDDLDTEIKQLSGDLGTGLGVITQVYGAISTTSHWLDQAQGGTLGWATAVNELWTGVKQTLDPLTQINTAVSAVGKVFGIGGDKAQAFDGSVQALTGNLAPFKAETYGVAAAEQALYTALSNTFTMSMNLDQANLKARQGLADLSSAIKTNGKHWDENTQAGRNNWRQLLTSIQADKDSYDAQVAAGGATQKATDKYNKQVDKLLALAGQAGLTKGQIQKLKDEYESIPPSKTLTFHVKVVGDLNAAQNLGRITGQRIANRWGGLYENRWGGVYQPAADGLLTTRAEVYPPVNPGRFMIAEPPTGGEAFIPKNGNYGRSMSILSAAAGWYGAHVVEGRGPGGGGSPVVVNLYASDPGGRALVNAIRLGVQGNGGDVVKVLTPR